MANFWEGLLGAAGPAIGFYDQYQRLDEAKGDVGNFFQGLQGGVDERTQFQPWSVSSSIGTGGYDPATGGINAALSPTMQGYADSQWGTGNALMQSAAQDPAARQQEFYERMRAGQMPGERRQQQQMEQQMFSRGRTGMGTQEFGGSPEQFAFEKARAEADNSAWLGSQQAAQQEAMQQFNMGQGMFASGFTPQQELLKLMGMGQNQGQLNSNMALNNAQMWAELGLGEQTARNNYSNMQNTLLGNMWGTLGTLGQGIGQGMDDTPGGALAYFKNLFGIGD